MDHYQYVETDDFLKPYFDFKELIKETNSMKVADLWMDLYNSNYAIYSELFYKESFFKSHQHFIEYLSDLKSNEGRNFRNTQLLVKFPIAYLSVLEIIFDESYSIYF